MSKRKIEILYPRKCVECEYMAKSPALYSMHKRCHMPIIFGTLCDMGCGKTAKFRSMNKKVRCLELAEHCPAYLAKMSASIEKTWLDNHKRKAATKKTFLQYCAQNEVAIAKNKENRRKKFLSYEYTDDRKKYDRRVHYRSQCNYKQYESLINPSSLAIGRFQHHLDHKVSKHVGFLLGIPSEYMASFHNLEVIPYSENITKHSKCSIHPLDLLFLCQASVSLFEQVHSKLVQLGDSFESLLSSRKIGCELS
jgi:hypothetical protein